MKSKLQEAVDVIQGTLTGLELTVELALIGNLIHVAKDAQEIRRKALFPPEDTKAKVRAKKQIALAKQAAQKTILQNALTMYEKIKVMDVPIGDLHYHELSAVAKTSQYMANLCNLILAHGRPIGDKPVRVRDFISEEVLAKLDIEARRQVKQSRLESA